MGGERKHGVALRADTARRRPARGACAARTQRARGGFGRGGFGVASTYILGAAVQNTHKKHKY